MVYRIFVEKKPGLDNEARALENDAKTLLGIQGLEKVRLLNRYDVEDISEDLFRYAVRTVFSEPQLDIATEEADVEGAAEIYKFFAIKLRYLSPTVMFVTILSLINSFKVFREVYLLAGDYPYEKLYMLQHFMNNTFRSLDYQKLSAAAVIMAIVMVVLIALLFKVEDWFGKDVEG